jgi:hypothetical protein
MATRFRLEPVGVEATSHINAGNVSLRCPSCRQQGTFAPIGQQLSIVPAAVHASMYACPNAECRGLIYVVTDPANRVLSSYPPELLAFDATNIPTEVREALEEAIKCHSQECFVAAAIMVRKTLEELCRNRGATGSNLKERIADLGTKIVLPQELLDGLDDLRLLGNDAAHIESTVFNGIGREDVEVGIEFATEVLKAVYQYSDLLARLRALKQTP